MTSDPSDIEHETAMTGAELLQRAKELGVDVVSNEITAAYMAEHCAETGENPEFEGLSPAGMGGVYRGIDTIWSQQIAEYMPEPPQSLPKLGSAFDSAAPGVQPSGTQSPSFDILKGPS